jgi:hypothetical protein
MEPMILRSLERLMDVAIGGLSIYLGYKLFLKLPEKTDSQGRILLPGNISIYLSRVGPGIFFALFGAVVIALSLHNAIEYEKSPAQNQSNDVALVNEKYLGIHSDRFEGELLEREIRKSEISRHMYWLNQIPSILKPDLPQEKKVDVSNGLNALKLQLIRTIWDKEWGDYSKFEEWANLGAEENTAEGFSSAAADMYNQGLRR